MEQQKKKSSNRAKGHGLWTLNVTAMKERFDPSFAPSVSVFTEKVRERDPSLFSVHYLRTLICGYLYLVLLKVETQSRPDGTGYWNNEK